MADSLHGGEEEQAAAVRVEGDAHVASSEGATVAVTRVRFTELPLSQRTQRALTEAGFVRMTAIQRAALPHALAGRDVLGAAKTGSGKTLAFVIPVLEALWRARWTRHDGVGAIILSPTRELAAQTFAVLRAVGKHHSYLSAGLLIGGGGEKRVQREQAHVGQMAILVCTPGRLLQHLETTATFTCDALRVLVLDEADRMLDLGFQRELDAILAALPTAPQRQTLLFSATQSASVTQLSRLALDSPEYVHVHAHARAATPSRLAQYYTRVGLGDKIDVLWSFIRSHLRQKTLVFLSAQKQVRFVFEALRRLRPGVPLTHLHGRMSQQKRLDVFAAFSAAQHGAVLFATDVAARGLDFERVDWVLQLDCPENVDTYIHRAGRTARMNAAGASLLVLQPHEADAFVPQLERRKVPVTELQLNPNKQESIRARLATLLLQDDALKLLAQKAVRAYVKAVHVAHDKSVFRVEALALDELAMSYGLASTPVLTRKGSGATAVRDKNVNKQREKLERVLALNTEEAEESGRLLLRPKKQGHTQVERLLKRKPQRGLSEEQQKLLQLDGADDNDDADAVLVKKATGQAHLQDLDALAPLSDRAAQKMAQRAAKLAARDPRTLAELALDEDRTRGFHQQAQAELHAHDALDKARLKERLHGERLKRKAAERAKEERRHGGDQRVRSPRPVSSFNLRP